jgi:hypothetical protein
MVSVATYVSRLPAPAVDVTAWSASIDDNSPVEEGAKPLDTKDNSPALALPGHERANILNTKDDPEGSAS